MCRVTIIAHQGYLGVRSVSFAMNVSKVTIISVDLRAYQLITYTVVKKAKYACVINAYSHVRRLDFIKLTWGCKFHWCSSISSIFYHTHLIFIG